MKRDNKSVGVFVYGDVGRSPRMQNHTLELVKHYKQVYLMGYLDSQPRSELLDDARIKFINLDAKWLQRIRKVSYYLYVLVRIIFQILQLLNLFVFRLPQLEFVLIQNPPSIPNLMAIWIASLIRKYNIYIDFHNYGYTILALNITNRTVLKFAERYQRFFARKCHKAFCVSEKMKQDLKEKWKIQAVTLYDRPLGKTRREVDRAEFFKKYQLQAPQKDDIVCVSSTSWTKDEDFSILLDAVSACDEQITYLHKRLRVYITGKGPEKQFYLQKMAQLRPSWKSVSIDTVWLQADDYPILLSLCDFGVCLHYSSSGLDLPMKVVDMFEAGLPVLAIKYEALSQLVKDTQNGFVFQGKEQLKQKLIRIVENDQIKNKLKKFVDLQKEHTWTKQWNNKFFK